MEKEMKVFKPFIAKNRIKHYLGIYPYLNAKIRQRELSHIKYGPSFEEFLHNENTIENQVIAMNEDFELQEMKFYKDRLDRHLYILKITKEIKYYNYILWNYIKRLPKEETQKRLGATSIKDIDNEIIEYLYITMLKEAINYGE